jgi:hypothetical protein
MPNNQNAPKKAVPSKNSGTIVLMLMFAATLLLVVGLSALSLKLFAPNATVEPEVLRQAAAATLNVAVPIFVDETLNVLVPAIVSGTLAASAPTATPIPPTPTQPFIPCDLAGFVADGSIPNGSQVSASTPFTKVWIIRNVGTCTWTEDYMLVFSDGELMAGKSPLTLGRVLAPGDSMEISINLVSPAAAGVYVSHWMLQNGAGEAFGLGPDNLPLSLYISVAPHQANALDFAKTACLAVWMSATGQLACPETEDYTGGAVNPTEIVFGEGGVEFNLPALEVIPNEGPGGKITGTYNPFQIQDGDSFHATIACADNQPECDLLFELLYDPGDHQPVSLGKWTEVTDGAHQKIVVDLSFLRGKTIQLILSVATKNNTAYDNKGLWVSPFILRSVD